MHIQNLVKFCPFFLKMLSENLILTNAKGHNAATNLQKMTGNNPNLDVVNMNVNMKFDPFVFKILSRNEILTSIKGHKSVTNVRKMTDNNPNLDFVNINSYAKFGEILSICSKDIE